MSGRSRRTAELRREEILTTTLDVVERAGLAATRVSDVAAALGVSPALVFYHFRTKDDLVAAAFAHAAERDVAALEEIAASADAPLDRLRRMLRLYGPTGSATGWQLWIDAWALAQREQEIQAVMRRMDQRWCAVLRDVVESGVASADFHCPDPGGRGHPDLGPARRALRGDAGLPQRHPRPAAPLGGGGGGARARARPGAAL